MTHSGGKPHAVGYEGQQYEVSFFNENENTRQVMGWTNSIDGANKMADAIRLHPSWTFEWITDLFAECQHDGHPAESAVFILALGLTDTTKG